MAELANIQTMSEADQLIEILDAAIVALERRDLMIGHEAMRLNGRLAHLRQLCDDWLKPSED